MCKLVSPFIDPYWLLYCFSSQWQLANLQQEEINEGNEEETEELEDMGSAAEI